MVSTFGAETSMRSITPLIASDALDAIAAEGKARTAQALRVFLRDSFREAVVKGWATANPIIDTKLKVDIEVKRSRLSLEVFQQIRAAAGEVWLQNAMDLALVSGQRREDISKALFRDFHDEAWWCVQSSLKGPNRHRIVIPLDLRLNCVSLSLRDVVGQCRRTGIVSKYLVHQTVARGNSPVGRHIWIDSLSKRFAETLAGLRIDWAPKEPPTFHEIRSLSERLYSAQGGVNTQELLGHNDAETTAMYHDDRGLDWVRIKLP